MSMTVEIEVISRRFSELAKMERQIFRLADLKRQMEHIIALRRTVRRLNAQRALPKGSRRRVNYTSVRDPITARPSFAGTSLSRR
jgi:hypothetical protein